jgi:mannosyltransferase OCH1-like enzyme
MRSRSRRRLIRSALIACIFVVAWIQFSIFDSPVALVLGQWDPELVGDLQTLYDAGVIITDKAMGSDVESKLETAEERSTTASVRHLREKKEEVKTTTRTLFPPNMFWTARDANSIRMKERRLRKDCEKLNPHYRAHIYNDTASRDFVATEFPEFLTLYNGLTQSVMKADMWRYLILYHQGGVYFDLDVECLKPIDEWAAVIARNNNNNSNNKTSAPRAIVGIEFRDAQSPLLQFSQWTMASQPRLPIFYRTVQLINETVAQMRQGMPSPGNAEHITGPKMFTRAVVEYLVEQGRLRPDQVTVLDTNVVHVNDANITADTDEQVGNLLILHKNAFGYHRMHANVTNIEKYARHLFAGRWRVESRDGKQERL